MEKKGSEKKGLPKTGTLELSPEQLRKLEQTISMNTIQGTDTKDLAKALRGLLKQK
ncbi:hypothetical protein [Desulforamulus aeronauticus]|uniref:Uncharacterized protein n=1 Tax=Desulforamulus aeronauticus DSM 10349 TaxID=1121421 RepID=A0A1M6R562_9FIRM|nr:hypothetical protein [Desulforamulus aeronauticus]SHK27582.1 hypothetical protein SAMN02745123_01303 [Desulforamulus aeronauticus DSM 10349]